MRIRLQCGLIEAGLAACLSSFCLASPAAPSETSQSLSQNSPTNENALLAAMESQHKAVLAGLERIREGSEAALSRYTESIRTQTDALEDGFALQQAGTLRAAELVNRRTEVAVEIMIAVTFISLLVLAWIPLWATNRVSKRLLTLARAREFDGGSVIEDDAEVVMRLQTALNRLEGRLLSLETLSSRAPTAGHLENREESAPLRVAAPKPPQTPRVALALGDGAALMFLPNALHLPKGGSWRRHLTRLGRLLHRTHL